MNHFWRYKVSWFAITTVVVIFSLATIIMLKRTGHSNDLPAPEDRNRKMILAQDSEFSPCSIIRRQESIFVNTDFGVVAPGETIIRKLRIQNDSDCNWKIKHVEMSCGCTDTAINIDEVIPAEFVEISIRLKAPDESTLKTTKTTIYIESDCINFIEITANIVSASDLTIIPNEIRLGTRQQAGFVEKEFVVYNYSEVKWDGLEFTADQEEYISCSFHSESIDSPSIEWKTARLLGKPFQEWRVRMKVRLGEAIRPGNYITAVLIRPNIADAADSPEPGQLTISFRVPPIIELRPIKDEYFLRGGSITNLVLVINDSTFREPTATLSTSVSDNSISVRHQLIAPGVYDFMLEVSNAHSSASSEGVQNKHTLSIILQKKSPSGEAIDAHTFSVPLVIH